LEKFFKAINGSANSPQERKDYLLVWEPRGRWERKEILSLCEKLDLVPCVDPFKNEPFPGKIGYFRLHGKTGYRYKYTDSDLEKLKKIAQVPTKARQLSQATNSYNQIYFMFNNVFLFEDASRFQKIMINLLAKA